MASLDTSRRKIRAFKRTDLLVTLVIFVLPHTLFGMYAVRYLVENWDYSFESGQLAVLLAGTLYCFLLPTWMLLDVFFHRIILYDDFLEERKLGRIRYVNMYSAITRLIYVPDREIRIRFADGGKLTFIFGDLDEELEFLQSKVPTGVNTEIAAL